MQLFPSHPLEQTKLDNYFWNSIEAKTFSIGFIKKITKNTYIAEPLEARGQAHKMSVVGGRQRNRVNCVTGEVGFQYWRCNIGR